MESSATDKNVSSASSRRSRAGLRVAALAGALLSAGALVAVPVELGVASGPVLDSVAIGTPWPGSTCCPGSND